MKQRNLIIEQKAVSALIPYARNACTHSDDQVREIAGSIREYGWTNPVLIDEEGGIIAGHGRVRAARLLGLVEVPCIVLDGLTPQQRKAYMLADNKMALNAGWDEALLALELEELKDAGYDMALTGFNNDEVLALMAKGNQGLTDENDTPAVPITPISQIGDIWVLNGHRIACGDSTHKTAVDALLAGVKPNLMVTDPPYGVGYDAEWRVQAGLQKTGAHGKVDNDDRADWREAWALFPGSVAYVWHGGLHAGAVADSLAARKLKVRAQIVWVKTRPVIGRGNYHWQHEPCLYAVEDKADDGWRFVEEHDLAAYAVREGGVASWGGGRKQSTVWFIEHIKSETGHSTQKPVECMRRPIENNSSPGQAIYEPFAGSGTTLIACEQTGRVCYAMELNPAYVDVSVLRWCNFTGQDATRLSDGQSFQDLKNALG